MFKRINKRLQKKEKEEAIGLDDEMKGILGMNDTDSDESDSSSESDGGGSGGGDSDAESEDELSEDAQDSAGLKRKRLEREARSSSEEEEEEDMEEGVNEDEADDTVPPMTISEALVEPLYAVRPLSEAKVCILCPGKALKHAQMASVHVSSSTHLRRAKRFAALAARVEDEDEDPRLLVAALDKSVRIAPNEKTSRPAKPITPTESRMSRQERREAKRQRRQERKTAKELSSKASSSPSKATKKQPTTTAIPPKSASISSERVKSSKQTVAHSVIQTKLTNKQIEAVKKHKTAGARKASHLDKAARPKKPVS
ncbi:hypothetical protein BDV93DRAFT_606188 [Ceratobasidium sp. AG-I]|nr:hypothetical protein BDV93DRAFT_606188 [Ceratobasidium sp. AG-I]